MVGASWDDRLFDSNELDQQQSEIFDFIALPAYRYANGFASDHLVGVRVNNQENTLSKSFRKNRTQLKRSNRTSNRRYSKDEFEYSKDSTKTLRISIRKSIDLLFRQAQLSNHLEECPITSESKAYQVDVNRTGAIGADRDIQHLKNGCSQLSNEKKSVSLGIDDKPIDTKDWIQYLQPPTESWTFKFTDKELSRTIRSTLSNMMEDEDEIMNSLVVDYGSSTSVPAALVDGAAAADAQDKTTDTLRSPPYDPLYDVAFEFARTHGYGFVHFVDEPADEMLTQEETFKRMSKQKEQKRKFSLAKNAKSNRPSRQRKSNNPVHQHVPPYSSNIKLGVTTCRGICGGRPKDPEALWMNAAHEDVLSSVTKAQQDTDNITKSIIDSISEQDGQRECVNEKNESDDKGGVKKVTLQNVGRSVSPPKGQENRGITNPDNSPKLTEHIRSTILGEISDSDKTITDSIHTRLRRDSPHISQSDSDQKYDNHEMPSSRRSSRKRNNNTSVSPNYRSHEMSREILGSSGTGRNCIINQRTSRIDEKPRRELFPPCASENPHVFNELYEEQNSKPNVVSHTLEDTTKDALCEAGLAATGVVRLGNKSETDGECIEGEVEKSESCLDAVSPRNNQSCEKPFNHNLTRASSYLPRLGLTPSKQYRQFNSLSATLFRESHLPLRSQCELADYSQTRQDKPTVLSEVVLLRDTPVDVTKSIACLDTTLKENKDDDSINVENSSSAQHSHKASEIICNMRTESSWALSTNNDIDIQINVPDNNEERDKYENYMIMGATRCKRNHRGKTSITPHFASTSMSISGHLEKKCGLRAGSCPNLATHTSRLHRKVTEPRLRLRKSTSPQPRLAKAFFIDSLTTFSGPILTTEDSKSDKASSVIGDHIRIDFAAAKPDAKPQLFSPIEHEASTSSKSTDCTATSNPFSPPFRPRNVSPRAKSPRRRSASPLKQSVVEELNKYTHDNDSDVFDNVLINSLLTGNYCLESEDTVQSAIVGDEIKPISTNEQNVNNNSLFESDGYDFLVEDGYRLLTCPSNSHPGQHKTGCAHINCCNNNARSSHTDSKSNVLPTVTNAGTRRKWGTINRSPNFKDYSNKEDNIQEDCEQSTPQNDRIKLPSLTTTRRHDSNSEQNKETDVPIELPTPSSCPKVCQRNNFSRHENKPIGLGSIPQIDISNSDSKINEFPSYNYIANTGTLPPANGTGANIVTHNGSAFRDGGKQRTPTHRGNSKRQGVPRNHPLNKSFVISRDSENTEKASGDCVLKLPIATPERTTDTVSNSSQYQSKHVDKLELPVCTTHHCNRKSDFQPQPSLSVTSPEFACNRRQDIHVKPNLSVTSPDVPRSKRHDKKELRLRNNINTSFDNDDHILERKSAKADINSNNNSTDSCGEMETHLQNTKEKMKTLIYNLYSNDNNSRNKTHTSVSIGESSHIQFIHTDARGRIPNDVSNNAPFISRGNKNNNTDTSSSSSDIRLVNQVQQLETEMLALIQSLNQSETHLSHCTVDNSLRDTRVQNYKPTASINNANTSAQNNDGHPPDDETNGLTNINNARSMSGREREHYRRRNISRSTLGLNFPMVSGNEESNQVQHQMNQIDNSTQELEEPQELQQEIPLEHTYSLPTHSINHQHNSQPHGLWSGMLTSDPVTRPLWSCPEHPPNYNLPFQSNQMYMDSENHPRLPNNVPYCPTTENYWQMASNPDALRPSLGLTNNPTTTITQSHINFVENTDIHANNDNDRHNQMDSAELSGSHIREMDFTDIPQSQHASLSHGENPYHSSVIDSSGISSISELYQHLDRLWVRSQSQFTQRLEDIGNTMNTHLRQIQRFVEQHIPQIYDRTEGSRTGEPVTFKIDKGRPINTPYIQLNGEATKGQLSPIDFALDTGKENCLNDSAFTRNNSKDSKLTECNQEVCSFKKAATFPSIKFAEVRTENNDHASYSENDVLNQTQAAPSHRHSRKKRENISRYKSVRQWKQEVSSPDNKPCIMRRGSSRCLCKQRHSRCCRRRRGVAGTSCNRCLLTERPGVQTRRRRSSQMNTIYLNLKRNRVSNRKTSAKREIATIPLSKIGFIRSSKLKRKSRKRKDQLVRQRMKSAKRLRKRPTSARAQSPGKYCKHRKYSRSVRDKPQLLRGRKTRSSRLASDRNYTVNYNKGFKQKSSHSRRKQEVYKRDRNAHKMYLNKTQATKKTKKCSRQRSSKPTRKKRVRFSLSSPKDKRLFGRKSDSRHSVKKRVAHRQAINTILKKKKQRGAKCPPSGSISEITDFSRFGVVQKKSNTQKSPAMRGCKKEKHLRQPRSTIKTQRVSPRKRKQRKILKRLRKTKNGSRKFKSFSKTCKSNNCIKRGICAKHVIGAVNNTNKNCDEDNISLQTPSLRNQNIDSNFSNKISKQRFCPGRYNRKVKHLNRSMKYPDEDLLLNVQRSKRVQHKLTGSAYGDSMSIKGRRKCTYKITYAGYSYLLQKFKTNYNKLSAVSKNQTPASNGSASDMTDYLVRQFKNVISRCPRERLGGIRAILDPQIKTIEDCDTSDYQISSTNGSNCPTLDYRQSIDAANQLWGFSTCTEKTSLCDSRPVSDDEQVQFIGSLLPMSQKHKGCSIKHGFQMMHSPPKLVAPVDKFTDSESEYESQREAYSKASKNLQQLLRNQAVVRKPGKIDSMEINRRRLKTRPTDISRNACCLDRIFRPVVNNFKENHLQNVDAVFLPMYYNLRPNRRFEGSNITPRSYTDLNESTSFSTKSESSMNILNDKNQSILKESHIANICNTTGNTKAIDMTGRHTDSFQSSSQDERSPVFVYGGCLYNAEGMRNIVRHNKYGQIPIDGGYGKTFRQTNEASTSSNYTKNKLNTSMLQKQVVVPNTNEKHIRKINKNLKDPIISQTTNDSKEQVSRHICDELGVQINGQVKSDQTSSVTDVCKDVPLACNSCCEMSNKRKFEIELVNDKLKVTCKDSEIQVQTGNEKANNMTIMHGVENMLTPPSELADEVSKSPNLKTFDASPSIFQTGGTVTSRSQEKDHYLENGLGMNNNFKIASNDPTGDDCNLELAKPHPTLVLRYCPREGISDSGTRCSIVEERMPFSEITTTCRHDGSVSEVEAHNENMSSEHVIHDGLKGQDSESNACVENVHGSSDTKSALQTLPHQWDLPSIQIPSTRSSSKDNVPQHPYFQVRSPGISTTWTSVPLSVSRSNDYTMDLFNSHEIQQINNNSQIDNVLVITEESIPDKPVNNSSNEHTCLQSLLTTKNPQRLNLTDINNNTDFMSKDGVVNRSGCEEFVEIKDELLENAQLSTPSSADPKEETTFQIQTQSAPKCDEDYQPLVCSVGYPQHNASDPHRLPELSPRQNNNNAIPAHIVAGSSDDVCRIEPIIHNCDKSVQIPSDCKYVTIGNTPNLSGINTTKTPHQTLHICDPMHSPSPCLERTFSHLQVTKSTLTSGLPSHADTPTFSDQNPITQRATATQLLSCYNNGHGVYSTSTNSSNRKRRPVCPLSEKMVPPKKVPRLNARRRVCGAIKTRRLQRRMQWKLRREVELSVTRKEIELLRTRNRLTWIENRDCLLKQEMMNTTKSNTSQETQRRYTNTSDADCESN